MTKKVSSSNDNRSNSLNPNNSAYRAAQIHQSNTYNPNNGEYRARLKNHANQLNPNHSNFGNSND